MYVLYPMVLPNGFVGIIHAPLQVVKRNFVNAFDSVHRRKYDRNMRKNPFAVGLAKRAVAKGAPSKGGKARARKLSPERRREIAKKAVHARWAKAKGTQQS